MIELQVNPGLLSTVEVNPTVQVNPGLRSTEVSLRMTMPAAPLVGPLAEQVKSLVGLARATGARRIAVNSVGIGFMYFHELKRVMAEQELDIQVVST